MHIRKWIARIRKPTRSSARTKKPSKARSTSPKIAQVVAVSAVAMMAVAGLVLAAYEATPSPKAATPVLQPVTTEQNEAATKTPPRKSTAHAVTASAQVPERVTISGCLEQTHDGFRLKDTEGTDAPKSRSWKTVFLTKHPATLDVVDERNRLRLGNHLGERVSVTGTLVARELDARTISRVAESCS